MPRSDWEGGKGQSAGGWEGHTPSGPSATGASSSFGASFVAAVWPSSGAHTPEAAQNIHSLRFSKVILQRWFNRQRSYRRPEAVSMWRLRIGAACRGRETAPWRRGRGVAAVVERQDNRSFTVAARSQRSRLSH